jgi:hypothetical protein
LNAHPRKEADLKSRGVGLLVLLGGIAVTALTWRWASQDGHYDVKAAVIGPLMLVLGIGFLVHGAEIPLDGIRPLTRIYGVAGSLAGIFYLYLLGFFERPHRSEAARLLDLAVPVVLIAVWFLPERFYGGAGHVPERPADASIEPR